MKTGLTKNLNSNIIWEIKGEFLTQRWELICSDLIKTPSFQFLPLRPCYLHIPSTLIYLGFRVLPIHKKASFLEDMRTTRLIHIKKHSLSEVGEWFCIRRFWITRQRRMQHNIFKENYINIQVKMHNQIFGIICIHICTLAKSVSHYIIIIYIHERIGRVVYYAPENMVLNNGMVCSYSPQIQVKLMCKTICSNFWFGLFGAIHFTQCVWFPFL